MMTADQVIVIGSAGRRLYLIDWFRDAFLALGLSGRVAVTESDPTSSSASYGDIARRLPRYEDPAYGPALLDLVEELRPKLFISVNDYELMHLHVRTDLAEQLRRRGVLVPGIAREWQLGVADKLLMSRLLEDIGVPTPRTVTGADREGIGRLIAEADELVIKHRFGSGSSGLALVKSTGVDEAVAAAVRSAPRSSGEPATAEDVIVQKRLLGVEYGVDFVGSLRTPGTLDAVLARRKLRMRAGETDKAVTVAPGPFLRSAELIAQASGLSGLIDVDVFLDEDEPPTVIDVNPRFGGGYPFVHLAGADVPRHYLAQAFSVPDDERWQSYTTGVTAAKYESVRVTGHDERAAVEGPFASSPQPQEVRL
jgi:carbamoyl-phosphate synthase large subunit